MWGAAKILRGALVDAGTRLDRVQARWLTSTLDARGSQANASQALDHASPAHRNSIPDFMRPPEMAYDDPMDMAGG